MHFHLDPVGGIAGDMFAAAFIDLRPEYERGLQEEFEAAGLARHVQPRSWGHRDEALGGRRVEMRETNPVDVEPHRPYRDIRSYLEGTDLARPVLTRALAIFDLLAGAEGKVHDLEKEDVSFHEVGTWDSIADVVAAAWLIEAAGPATWSCAALPLGGGRVKTRHGTLPIPAPATVHLLEGYPVYQDGIEGERVTPTGAAILRHLSPDFTPLSGTARLLGSGFGFGSRKLPGTRNVLRVMALETDEQLRRDERLTACVFEVDDQTPEDLAVALERLRGVTGVLDVTQHPCMGKKSRLGAQVQILARADVLEAVLGACFHETTTLGVRWHPVRRAALRREELSRETTRGPVQVKRAFRSEGLVTEKAEIDGLARVADGHAGRERLRRRVEAGTSHASTPKTEDRDEE